MTKIILIRHAQTKWNQLGLAQGWANSPVTEQGLKQTKRLVDSLIEANLGPNVVYSSPIGRALELSHYLASRSGCECSTTEALKEQSFGSLEGKSISEAGFCDDFGNPRADFSQFGGEDREKVAQRALNFIKEIDLSKDGLVAVVTHGRLIEAVVAKIHTGSTSNAPKYPHPNTSYSLLESAGKGLLVSQWGVATHL